MSSDQRFFDFLKERIGLDVTSVGPAIIERAVRQRSTASTGADGRRVLAHLAGFTGRAAGADRSGDRSRNLVFPLPGILRHPGETGEQTPGRDQQHARPADSQPAVLHRRRTLLDRHGAARCRASSRISSRSKAWTSARCRWKKPGARCTARIRFAARTSPFATGISAPRTTAIASATGCWTKCACRSAICSIRPCSPTSRPMTSCSAAIC